MSITVITKMNRALPLIGLVAALSAAMPQTVLADDDLFEFFAEEAQVITASRRPRPIRQVPATVYVIKGEELTRAGVHTLWDALRSVPGVDVMSMRTFHGMVSIRGLNKGLNNRTLILLDGRTVLDGNADSINWEALPVLPEEIERIEVVEGPASALYGANAINGVINIITKTPEQLAGNQVSYSAGARRTHLGSFVYGEQRDKAGYKVGLGWRTTNRFEDADLRASRVAIANAHYRRELADEAHIRLSAGATRADTDHSIGAVGQAVEDADRGFVRADYERGRTRLRAFWNRGRGNLKGLASIPLPGLDYDIYDFNLVRTVALASDNSLVVGGGFRRNGFDSNLIPSGSARHNLWNLFFENEWHPMRRWTFWTSGRLDRHPHVGLEFSPRFSVVFVPVPAHVLRFSAGTSFRNPTLFENHMAIDLLIEVNEEIQYYLESQGSTDLDPERMVFFEVAHTGQLDRFKTTAAAFHYRLRDGVTLSAPTFNVSEDQELEVSSSLINQGEAKAWGGEAGVEILIREQVTGSFNYSYQHLSGEVDRQTADAGMPHHKFNGGLRLQRGRFDFNTAIHWVDRTLWNNNQTTGTSPFLVEVDSYTLLNLHLGYRFGGRLQDLEVGLDIFNVLGNDHFETLRETGPATPGQGGEIIRSRQTLKLSYTL